MSARGDLFGWLGGDEFVMMLQAGTVAAAASRVATVHRHLRVGLGGSAHPIGVSLGALVVRPGSNLEWPKAIRVADRLMYVAKRQRSGSFSNEVFGETARPDAAISFDAAA